MRWTFDRRVQRYRDRQTGRFLGEAALQNLIRQNNAQLQESMQSVNSELINGDLNAGQWELQVRAILKNLHISNYLLGRGGAKELTSRDYGRIGAILASEYRYLRGVVRDLVAGRMSERQFRARMNIYLSKVNSTFEIARRLAHQINGFVWERRVRNAMESCAECITYEAAGWQPIGTLPGVAAQCSCRGNCKCHFEYAREIPTDHKLLTRRYGWIA